MRGWCESHYERWYRTGDVQADKPLRVQGAGCIRDDGYVEYYRPEHPSATRHGKVLGHRMVMSDHLGRALLPSEHVHHMNGDRGDNRLENLELWVKAHPFGQRVEDVTAWAVEHLRLYAPDLLQGE